MNSTISDIGSEITGSLARNGESAMTGQLKAATGSVAAPGISFSADTDTGFYRKAANEIGVVVGGVEVAEITSAGITDTAGGIPTGAMMMYGATSAPSGWLRCNGRTIGNASSSGTERANADTESLFTFLWTNYSDSVCAVSGGRGASAAADYAANKRIALPDLRGRAFFGLDDMGGAAASRLGSVISNQTTNGSSGGAETVTLAEANLPAHTHSAGTLATASDGAHTHTFTYNTSLIAANNVTSPVSDIQTNGGGTTVTTTSNGAHTHTISGSTGSIGSGTAVANMPPAFLTTFIIKL